MCPFCPKCFYHSLWEQTRQENTNKCKFWPQYGWGLWKHPNVHNWAKRAISIFFATFWPCHTSLTPPWLRALPCSCRPFLLVPLWWESFDISFLLVTFTSISQSVTPSDNHRSSKHLKGCSKPLSLLQDFLQTNQTSNERTSWRILRPFLAPLQI